MENRVRAVLETAADRTGEGPLVFTKLLASEAIDSACVLDRTRAEPHLALRGLLISIKDLFDVRGSVTTAGSIALTNEPPAIADAPVIASVRRAGGILIGRTNMTEFAYSGVGLNPHYGTPRNPWQRRDAGRVPGGSSSGAAVAVTDGYCDVSLVSDTGGSARIPAALCGIVGWKPAAARVDRAGVYALSGSLDSVGVIAESVQLCSRLDRVIASAVPVRRWDGSLASLRLVIPQCYVLEGLQPAVAQAFGQALSRIAAAGVRLLETPAATLDQLLHTAASAAIVGREAWVHHRALIEARGASYDPRVRQRIEAGQNVTPEAYREALALRWRLGALMHECLSDAVAWLMPTVPILAPRIDDLISDATFFEVNRVLLRNPALVNFLDGCALTLPCQEVDNGPVGLSICGEAGADADVLAIAAALAPIVSPQCASADRQSGSFFRSNLGALQNVS